VVFNKIKLYRPEEAPDFKWRNTCPGHYIQGLKQMNDRKSNNDTLITKSLKDVMVFYEFIGDRYDVIAPTAKLIFYRDLSKVFICQVHKIIIIYDFDLAELQVQTNLERGTPTSFLVKFVSTKE
jgi:hypothetical protein